jgi:membrane protease YdiL (CAAX protease family)
MMTDEAAATVQDDRDFPGIWASLGWVALFLVLQIIMGVFAFGIAVALNDSGEPFDRLVGRPEFMVLPTIWSLIASSMVLLGLLWLYLRKPGRMAAIGLDRWSSMSLPLTIGVAVLLIGAGLAFNHIYATYIIPDIKVQEAMRQLFAALPPTLPNKVVLFAAIALIAPLLEELLFRGLLQNSLSKKMPVWAAILTASAIFAAVHMDYHAFPPLLVMGAVFGLLYHLTGSLRVNILAHALNNAAALLLS